ncbi:MAG: hypothetical protein II527_07670 [Bacteroidales bacterium]|nr:hypothetical protein [Bacteroidales bacterium]MBQ2493192.1 hypothetical protein [Bacteroidales bacterium]MBQ4197875.1 hypothetical protein [Bacteroidales bacterium]
MSLISDLISKQVNSAAGGIEIPSDIKSQVLGGLGDSILGSLTQTAAKQGGTDMISDLLTGKTSAANSPITALAGNLFSTNILSKLNLGGGLAKSLTGLIPNILGGLRGFIKDQDGDGDVDLKDIMLSITGGGNSNGGGLGSIIGAAKGILGGILGGDKK